MAVNFQFFSSLLEAVTRSKSFYASDFFTSEVFDSQTIIFGVIKFFDTFCWKSVETTQVLLAIFKFLRAVAMYLMTKQPAKVRTFAWWKAIPIILRFEYFLFCFVLFCFFSCISSIKRKLEDLEKNFQDEVLETRLASTIIEDLRNVVNHASK